MGGVVIEKHVALGEAVKDDADIFTIADLATVLARVTVYTKDLKFVRMGQEVNVKSDVLDIEVAGKVTYLGPLLGMDTRTATAHVAIDNSDGLWRPGIFVTVRLVQEEFTAAVAVRPEAIQRIRDWDVARAPGSMLEVSSGSLPSESSPGVSRIVRPFSSSG